MRVKGKVIVTVLVAATVMVTASVKLVAVAVMETV